jgi:hypothetical protein
MISPWRAGLAFGAAVGLFHLAWVALVGAGLAQPLLNFILALHFIDLQVHIAAFQLGTAAALVALTAAIGSVSGAVFAAIWNGLHRDLAAASSD